MAKPSERLTQSIVDDFVEQQAAGSDQSVYYGRYDDDVVDTVLASADEAAERLGTRLHVAVVPAHYADAPVRRLAGTTIIRIADFPEPWVAAEID